MSAYADDARIEVAALVPPTKRLLDVGCNGGAFGASFASKGVEVWGVELNPAAAATAAAVLNTVVVGRYPEDFPEGQRFDTIVFNDVLEHMEDPAAALSSALQNLAPGGSVVASIPNVRHIGVVLRLALRGRWDYADGGILDRTHLRFYTRATMRELFEANGYRIERQEAINVTRPAGKFGFLRVLDIGNKEFLAQQYVVVARPTGAMAGSSAAS